MTVFLNVTKPRVVGNELVLIFEWSSNPLSPVSIINELIVLNWKPNKESVYNLIHLIQSYKYVLLNVFLTCNLK